MKDLSLFQSGVIFPLFQSVGTSSDCYSFSSVMDTGLATSSASSLRIHGCISSGPMGLYIFRFLRMWSQIWYSDTWVSLYIFQPFIHSQMVALLCFVALKWWMWVSWKSRFWITGNKIYKFKFPFLTLASYLLLLFLNVIWSFFMT